MHNRAVDIAGMRVGYLVAVRYHGANGKKSLWEAKCDCGKVVILPATEMKKQLKRGIIASCGCMRNATIAKRKTTHGMSHHPAFAVWRSMLDRCRLPTHHAYSRYGGRGIRVCDEWQQAFENFWKDMGPTYQKGATLERRDNSKGYSPENCAWRTRRQQANNTRRNVVLRTPNGTMTAKEASYFYEIKYTTLLYRLNNGWTIEKALGCTTS